MKKIIIFAFLLSFFAAKAQIETGTNFDLKANLPIDTRMQVQDTSARNAITHRWEGMTVYVISDNTDYILTGGTENSDWQILKTDANSDWKQSGNNLTTTDTVNIGTNNAGSKFEVKGFTKLSSFEIGDNNTFLGGLLSKNYFHVCTDKDYENYQWVKISGNYADSAKKGGYIELVSPSDDMAPHFYVVDSSFYIPSENKTEFYTNGEFDMMEDEFDDEELSFIYPFKIGESGIIGNNNFIVQKNLIIGNNDSIKKQEYGNNSNYNLVLGEYNSMSGIHSIISGYSNKLSSLQNSIILGECNSNLGNLNNSMIIGRHNEAEFNNKLLVGQYLQGTESYNSIWAGSYNQPLNDVSFGVGTGTSTTNRATDFYITNKGEMHTNKSVVLGNSNPVPEGSIGYSNGTFRFTNNYGTQYVNFRSIAGKIVYNNVVVHAQNGISFQIKGNMIYRRNLSTSDTISLDLDSLPSSVGWYFISFTASVKSSVDNNRMQIETCFDGDGSRPMEISYFGTKETIISLSGVIQLNPNQKISILFIPMLTSDITFTTANLSLFKIR